MSGLYRKLSPIEQAAEEAAAEVERRSNLGDTVRTSGGGTLILRNKAEALAYNRNPDKFIEAQADRIVPPPLAPDDLVDQPWKMPASGPRPDTLPAVAVTPAKKRLAKSRANLATGGGRRLEVNLPARAAEQLEEIKAADGHETDKGAIIALIAAQAARIARRKP